MPPPVPKYNITQIGEKGKSYEVRTVAEEKKKMGRPTDDLKNHELKIRMSDAYMKKMEYSQSKTGQTRADIIRSGIDMLYEKINQ